MVNPSFSFTPENGELVHNGKYWATNLCQPVKSAWYTVMSGLYSKYKVAYIIYHYLITLLKALPRGTSFQTAPDKNTPVFLQWFQFLCACLSLTHRLILCHLPSCGGCDCYQHSVSLSLYLGYSCYDNYYACQSEAVTHLYTLLSHNCIGMSVHKVSVYWEVFCHVWDYKETLVCAVRSLVVESRLVTQFDWMTHSLKKGSGDITVV